MKREKETPAIYCHRLVVPASAIDANGHANNVEYVRWMQDAAVAHADAVGCSAATREAGATWVVHTHHVEYLHSVFAGERVQVFTWVENLRKVRSLRKYRMVREADGVRVASGSTDWVFVHATTGRPLAIPSSVTEKFTLVEAGKEPGWDVLIGKKTAGLTDNS